MKNIVERIKQKVKALFFGAKTIDFIICGTQKAGTSALDAYLREHPEICMADSKEVHFFDNDEYFSDGKPDYSSYHSFFSPKKRQKVLGEATPIYMYWNCAPRRIWEYNPDMKLIVLLRNPIERAYSHWNMERTRNADELCFLDAVRCERDRCREALPQQHRVYSYIDRGFYLKQLRELWAYFPKEKVLIMKTEDLRQNPHAVLNRICDFLQISRFSAVEAKDVHSATYKSAINKREHDYLRSIFESEIKELELELNLDLSDWLTAGVVRA